MNYFKPGNYESEYGEFEFGGEQSKEEIGHRREGKSNITSGIGQGEGLLEGVQA